ncbi:hypothetical protein ACJJIL_17720 [Microbulbifer sp. EKSA005]|uniref:hypothetical protein n=1 Tax=Microbulbifer sp. EKSA005 TaxID=3243364 RepID=UPI0040411DAB
MTEKVKGTVKFRGLLGSLVISIGGYFATILAFAVFYTADRVLGNNLPLDEPDPDKLIVKMINFAVGMLFPFLAGIYCGRKNRNSMTYTHYLLILVTGLYVGYLIKGQLELTFVVLYSILAMFVVYSGYKLGGRGVGKFANRPIS